MLKYDTTRYGTDNFFFDKVASAVAWDNIDISQYSYDYISGFLIVGSEPSGTSRKFAFIIDNDLKILDTTGALQSLSVSGDAPKADIARAVLNSGNSAAQLTALTNVTSLIGKSVKLCVALSKPNGSSATVSASFALTAATISYTKDRTVIYNAVTFNDYSINIKSINPNVTKSGNSSLAIHVKLLVNGSWTDWLVGDSFLNTDATGYQIRTIEHVNTVNSDSIKVNNLVVNYLKKAA